MAHAMFSNVFILCKNGHGNALIQSAGKQKLKKKKDEEGEIS